MTDAKPSLTVSRHIKAPVHKVFQAWIEAEALKHWFRPSAKMTVLQAETDARIGGRYRFVIQESPGVEHRVGGTYKEFERNAKLVFTWAWESTPERVSVVTVRFKARDGGTDLTLVHEQIFDEPTRDHHLQGWQGVLDSLLRHAESAA
jgi:uncharacterized protein YndB with AHSA1/START domain